MACIDSAQCIECDFVPTIMCDHCLQSFCRLHINHDCTALSQELQDEESPKEYADNHSDGYRC